MPEQITHPTPEYIAFKLLKEVAKAEEKDLLDGPSGQRVDRRWILDAYAECLIAAKGGRYPE